MRLLRHSSSWKWTVVWLVLNWSSGWSKHQTGNFLQRSIDCHFMFHVQNISPEKKFSYTLYRAFIISDSPGMIASCTWYSSKCWPCSANTFLLNISWANWRLRTLRMRYKREPLQHWLHSHPHIFHWHQYRRKSYIHHWGGWSPPRLQWYHQTWYQPLLSNLPVSCQFLRLQKMRS